MQLFRSQLSRFSPHPHRDSWMRNHLKQWLTILRWASFFTLLSAGWLTYSQQSPIGDLYPLNIKIRSWTGITSDTFYYYFKLALAIFFALSGLLSFRCGDRYKFKYAAPVMISGLILALVAGLYAMEAEHVWLAIAKLALPVATPFLLLRYRVWKNQVDHWNIVVCLLLALTLVGYALQSLINPVGVPTLSGAPMIMSELSIDLNRMIVTSVGYIALGTALGLFLTTFRRLALYLSILLGITTVVATMFTHFSADFRYYNVGQWLGIPFLIITYWLLPLLVMLSLASQRKSQTLRL